MADCRQGSVTVTELLLVEEADLQMLSYAVAIHYNADRQVGTHS